MILANGLRPNATEEQYNLATGLLAQMQRVFDEKTKQSRGAQTQLYGIEAKQDAARDAYERAKAEREAIEAEKAKTRDEEHRKQLQLKQLDFEIKNYHTQMKYLNDLGTTKYEKIERDDDGNITGKASGYKPAAGKTAKKPATPDFTPRGFTPRGFTPRAEPEPAQRFFRKSNTGSYPDPWPYPQPGESKDDYFTRVDKKLGLETNEAKKRAALAIYTREQAKHKYSQHQPY